jgi:hypothetical protein
VSITSSVTLRFHPAADLSEIEAVRAIAESDGAVVAWVDSPAYERTYGLIESATARCAAALRATRATVFDRPIIALAVVPSVPEASPLLLDALGGAGRPAGVVGCEAFPGGVIVEWDLDETGLDVVLNLVDIEIDRFRAARVNALLTPLPLAWWTRIAAAGLHAQEISPDRVLEEQLKVHGVLD